MPKRRLVSFVIECRQHGRSCFTHAHRFGAGARDTCRVMKLIVRPRQMLRLVTVMKCVFHSVRINSVNELTGGKDNCCVFVFLLCLSVLICSEFGCTRIPSFITSCAQKAANITSLQDVKIFSNDPLARPENLKDGNLCSHDEETCTGKALLVIKRSM